MISPGATIGILGGGQLARMLALAARNMGYRIIVWEPSPSHCCHGLADWIQTAPWLQQDAAKEFASRCDVVTLEFENIPFVVAETLAQWVPVRPGSLVLKTAQNRVREKTFLRENHFPHAPWLVVESPEQLDDAVQALGGAVVLKTAESGYDGKGQWKIRTEEELRAVKDQLHGFPLVAEKWIDFRGEWSVLVARNPAGNAVTYPAIWNEHRNHILDTSWVWKTSPEEETRSELARIATDMARAIGLEGLMAVEFFWCSDGRVLVNEIAPRPHNSGHYSLDGGATSQFEQVIRAICELPMGEVSARLSVAMVNLLGDVWQAGEPDWDALLAIPGAHLHLYGKSEARVGRKMGHLNLVSTDARLLRRNVNRARKIVGLPVETKEPYPF
jgi:5-(carboxyamino)imidazole ribonucleotide synthase